MAQLRRRALGISPEETSFAKRRFRGEHRFVRERLEEVGRCFVAGYHAALEERRLPRLAGRLDEIPWDYRGFAYEGAAMALALLDALSPFRRRRFADFVAGPAAAHVYIAHIGAGWVLARLPLSPGRFLARFDPVLRWLALDGWGFHQGFFHWPRAVDGQEVPARLQGYARRAFDQGLGRSLWFVDGADVGRIPRTIAAFPAARRPDLWSGVGLACAYAGGRGRAEVEALRREAAGCEPELAQGAAFAAEARALAGNVTPATELACEVLCGAGAAAVAAVTRELRAGVPADDGVPAFELWRRRIQRHFAERSSA